MNIELRRLFAAIAAVAMLAVLAACMPPTPPTPPTPPGAGASVERTIQGEVPPKQSRWEPANCRDVGFVQRGANQTVPKLKLVLESPLWAIPIARDTEPNQFLSRNVTTMTIAVGAVEFDPRETRTYTITYWCTSDRDQAWTVFG